MILKALVAFDINLVTVILSSIIMIHQDLLYDDREAFVDGFYRHIPPTVNVNEDGKLVQTS